MISTKTAKFVMNSSAFISNLRSTSTIEEIKNGQRTANND